MTPRFIPELLAGTSAPAPASSSPKNSLSIPAFPSTLLASNGDTLLAAPPPVFSHGLTGVLVITLLRMWHLRHPFEISSPAPLQFNTFLGW
jgi:hypothetical protein